MSSVERQSAKMSMTHLVMVGRNFQREEEEEGGSSHINVQLQREVYCCDAECNLTIKKINEVLQTLHVCHVLWTLSSVQLLKEMNLLFCWKHKASNPLIIL